MSDHSDKARSAITGGPRISDEQQRVLASRRAFAAPAAAMTDLVPGGLYGTDGANLYLIDTTTGAASLIGPHGGVEVAIGAIAFGPGGVLYGISLTDAAQLYTIDVTTGAATAVGPLGVGFVFEGGLSFDAGGRLIGVDQGTSGTAMTFEINTATGAATIIGPPNGEDRDVNGLTRAGTVVYGIDRPSNTLGRLDVATGAYSQIGATGTAVGDTGGLAYRESDGRLFATFGADGGFYELDTTTGAATLIAVNNVDYGLAFAPSENEPRGRYSYSVKYVCGVQKDGEPADTVLRPGVYATDINIHNPHDREVTVRKFVLPLVHRGVVRGREPDFTGVRAHDAIVLPPNTATMDDCHRIAQLLFGGQPPNPLPLMIGFLEIVSPVPLAVDAVYTASGHEGEVVSIDVERVEPLPTS